MSEPYELTKEQAKVLWHPSNSADEYAQRVGEATRRKLLNYLCGRCTEHTEPEVLLTRRCCPDCIAKLLKAHGVTE